MKKSLLRILGLVAALLAVGGCDPEQLVKQKVPDPVKEVLGPPGTVAKKKKAGRKAVPKKVFEIVSPKHKAVLPDMKEIHFEVDLNLPDTNPIPDSSISWRWWDMINKVGGQLNTGRSFDFKVDQGHWAVGCYVTPPGKKKMEKVIEFWVKPSSKGKVTHNGGGLGGVEIKAVPIEGKKEEIGTVVSEKNGEFVTIMPEKDWCMLIPSKPGFSFSPPYSIVRKGGKPSGFEFQAAAAQIKDIRIAEDAAGTGALEFVCPREPAFVRAHVKSQTMVKRLSAYLTPPGLASREPILMGEVLDPPLSERTPDDFSIVTFPVKVPPEAIRDTTRTRFNLRITAWDEKGNAFAAEVPDAVTMDMSKCLAQTFKQAEALQEEGKYTKAAELYGEMEQYQDAMGSRSAFAALMEKMYFNRGLLYLQTAADLPEGDLKRMGYLAKAETDFDRVLEFHIKDDKALLLSGLVDHLKGDQEEAIEAHGRALALNPDLTEAYELRGRAFLASGRKKNLARAVDDFTAVLERNPDRSGLRRARKEALKLELENEDTAAEAELNTQSVPIGNALESVSLKDYRRE